MASGQNSSFSFVLSPKMNNLLDINEYNSLQHVFFLNEMSSFALFSQTNVLEMMKMSFYIIYSNDDLFQRKKLNRKNKEKKIYADRQKCKSFMTESIDPEKPRIEFVFALLVYIKKRKKEWEIE